MSPSTNPIRIVSALAACLAVVALSGCSTQQTVLARVGDRTITVAEYRELLAGVAARYPLPPDTAKGMVLDDLIRRDLMLVAAKGNPAVSDSFLTQRRKEIEEDALSRALLDQLTPHGLGASEAELRRLYLWRQQAMHCQLVFTLDPKRAAAARQAIDQGQDFGAVADEFNMPGSVPARGDLGLIEAGTLVNPLDRIVRESPVGAVIGPVEYPDQGWFIVKILGRQPRERGTYEQQAPELRTMLEQSKQHIAQRTSYVDLRRQYGLTTDVGGLQILYQRLNAAQEFQSPGADPGPVQLSPSDRALVIGRWDGGPGYAGTLTLGQAVDDLAARRGPRIMATRFDSYADWATSEMLQRVAVIEARRRHLGEEPATAEHVRQAVDEVMLQAEYQTAVLAGAEPNDAEIREAYERDAADFTAIKSVGVEYFAMPDSAMAVAQATRALEMGSIKRAGAAASPPWTVHDETVEFPTADPTWQILEVAFKRQSVGGLLGPIHAPDGWRIVQIVSRDAPTTPLEQLTPQQRQGVVQQARQFAGDRRLRAFTDSLRTTIPVTVDRRRLKSIPWPAPALMQMMQGMPGS